MVGWGIVCVYSGGKTALAVCWIQIDFESVFISFVVQTNHYTILWPHLLMGRVAASLIV